MLVRYGIRRRFRFGRWGREDLMWLKRVRLADPSAQIADLDQLDALPSPTSTVRGRPRAPTRSRPCSARQIVREGRDGRAGTCQGRMPCP
jgi:hypothetical protein